MAMARNFYIMSDMFQVTKKYRNINDNSTKIYVIITGIYLCLISSRLSFQMEELNGQQVP
jgi:ABC-type amino acid transport system permease subunit